ncbi:hypothetical protein D3C72_1556470 [compost metagenome]
MNEHLQLHCWHLLADFLNLFQRQLAGQDHPRQPLTAPEFDAGPVHGIGLHRQVNRHLREMLANQHDQARIGHDQRIRSHLNDRRQIFEEGFQLGVMRSNVDHDVKALALRLGFLDAESQVGVVELVIAHPQAVARLAGIHRIGAVGEGVAHVLQGAGRGEQFRFGKRSHDRAGLKGADATGSGPSAN